MDGGAGDPHLGEGLRDPGKIRSRHHGMGPITLHGLLPQSTELSIQQLNTGHLTPVQFSFTSHTYVLIVSPVSTSCRHAHLSPVEEAAVDGCFLASCLSKATRLTAHVGLVLSRTAAAAEWQCPSFPPPPSFSCTLTRGKVDV